MDTPRPYMRIGAFFLGLAAVFVAAAALGSVVEPAKTEGESSGMEQTMDDHGSAAAHGAHETTEEPAGLGVAADGYALRMWQTQLERGQAGELRFTVEGAEGEALTEFDELHERRLHLIVVRRDGTEFRHLHPEMDRDGTWATPVKFAEPGVYRAFADFSVGGEQQTLAADVFVSGGEFEAQPFPAPSALAKSAGYEVHLRADEPTAGAGESTELIFAVDRGGNAVDDLAPYLGAKGHLVALREGDLAYLHVHPEEHDGAANEIAFAAHFPTAGRYRLYLQFKHRGVVRTAEFTVEVPQ
jgi:hypothetical protein